MKLLEGNVFTHVCLPFLSKREYPCDHYQWGIGPQCTCPLQTLELSVQRPSPSPPKPQPNLPFQTLDFTVQSPPPLTASRHWTSLHRTLQSRPHGIWTPPYSDPPCSDIWWPSLETCSNLFTWGSLPPCTDIWWLLKDMQLASGQYASYWNAFLLPTTYVGR